MAFQPVPEACSVVVHMSTWDGREVENVFGVHNTATLTQSLTNSYSTVFKNIFDHLKAYVFSSNAWEGITMTDLRTEGAPAFESATSWPVTGTSGADPLPGQNAALMSWRTALRGRSYRGRTYIGGLTESAVTSGAITPGLSTAMQSFISDVVSNGTIGVISRYHDGALRDEGQWHQITSGVDDVWMRTQRRRAHTS